jgi:Ca2+-binding EF-hand superfamily protein
MNTKTVIAAALASVFAVTAVAPAFAAGDPAKHEKRMHRMIKRADTNRDGRISHAELANAISASFAVVDANGDGVLSQSELKNKKAAYKSYRQEVKASRQSGERLAGVIRMPRAVGKHFAEIDANGDGVISKSELTHVSERMFKRRDHNKDGYISAADFKA